MKALSAPHRGYHRTNLSSFTRIAALVAVIALIGIPFLFSSSAASNSGYISRLSQAAKAGALPGARDFQQGSGNALARLLGSSMGRTMFPTISALSPNATESVSLLSETIETFAADCTTPKSDFILGETVCAKTDNVDLNYAGGRWVDWILTGSPNTIVSGSSSTTLITTNPKTFTYVPAATGVYKVEITQTGTGGVDDPQTPAVFTVNPEPPIATYAAGCIISQSSFSLGESVCVKVTGAPVNGSNALRRINLLDADRLTVDSVDVTTSTQTATFVLPTDATSIVDGVTSDNRGNWQAALVDTDANIEFTAPFTVHDPSQQVSDVSISKVRINSQSGVANSAINSVIWVFNNGPDAAQNVQFVDSPPANTTFLSLTQNSGPTFSCTTPAVGSSNNSTCSVATLNKGQAAAFTISYLVDANVGSGETTDSVVVTTTTTDRTTTDNNSSDTTVFTNPNPPSCTITCPGNVTAVADTVEDVDGVPTSGAHVTFAAAETSGSCGTVTASTPSGSFFPLGSTPVTVSTSSGSCSFIVTVTSSGSPITISCPANVTANAGSDCAATVSVGTPTTTGDSVTVTSSRSDGKPLADPFPTGVTTITWTAANAAGTESCTQTVTVNDITAPTIIAPAPTSASADASCQAAVPDYTTSTTVSDNCACASSDASEICQTRETISVTQSPAAGTLVGLGPHTITLTAQDQAANVSTATVVFTVNDTTAPTFTFVPANISVSTGAGATTCDVVVDPGMATATDNCSVSVTRSPSGNTFPVGTTTITWSATDGSNNTTTATQTVTVIDNTPPTISCPANVTVYLPLNSTATSRTVTYAAATASDNCPGTTIAYSNASGSVFPVGPTTVTVTATDASGNSSSCQFTVTVLYNFTGFFSPIDNPPIINSMKAGQAAPVKFSLSGNKGLNIFASNSPSSVQVSCQSGAVISEVSETVNAGSSSLSYNATSDQYNYVWKTDSSWKNTCRQLSVTLNDGSTHIATFSFK
ncbi:MAG: hypothetical protein QOF62_2839 [Pyrinomonadaceae bacterium]|jgi:hypothetical protein|nr:hypothetical protein [Pyrinomonadaceae bacterium]